MSNAVSSLIFACRNVDKTKNGDIGRAPVAAAQGIKVLDEVARFNKVLAKGADATVSVFNDMAKKSKVVDYAVKGTKWAVNNVNPLICISGGLKVAMAEDKTTTAITEIGALSTMFAGEGIAKNLLQQIPDQGKLFNKINIGGKTGTILKGLSFVAASIGSYSIGQALAKDLAEDVKAKMAFKPVKINQIA